MPFTKESMRNTGIEAKDETLNAESAADEERYVLRTRRDILPHLVTLSKSRAPIRLVVQQLGVSITSSLIALNPEFEELVFDASALPGVERLNGIAGLSAEVQMDTVWYRFEAGHVTVVQGYPRPAFRARLPDKILRIQRRDSIRYPVPGVNPPVCDIPASNADAKALRLPAIDISNSGISLRIDDSRLSLARDTVLEGCMLHLPEIGAIACGLVVKYLSPLGEGDMRRIGCRFTDIHALSLNHLTQYVLRIERAWQESRNQA